MADEQTTPPPPTHKQINVQIESSGKWVGISLPLDLTDAEILEFVSWMTSPDVGLRNVLHPPSPIVLLDGHHPRPS